MSHYQLSNFAIHGLEHLETDMTSQLLALWVCVSSDTLQVGKRLKLYKEENYAIKSYEYLDWCTLIFLW